MLYFAVEIFLPPQTGPKWQSKPTARLKQKHWCLLMKAGSSMTKLQTAEYQSSRKVILDHRNKKGTENSSPQSFWRQCSLRESWLQNRIYNILVSFSSVESLSKPRLVKSTQETHFLSLFSLLFMPGKYLQ